jgi:nucleotide-binding universal stress UspA family protein
MGLPLRRAHEKPMDLPASRIKRIVCGVDFSPTSVAAFLTAAELARSVNAELHVVHVIEAYPPVGGRLFDAGQDHAQSLERTATSAMRTLVAKSPAALDSIRVTTEITPGLAFIELLHRVRDRSQDLIVVGASGVTLLEDAFVGGTAEQVVKQASCSVLVVRGQSPA